MNVAVVAATGLRRRLTVLLPWCVILVAGIATWPALRSLAAFWSGILDYEHGYVIAALAVIWLARILWRSAAQVRRPSGPATALLAMALLAWLVALRSSFDIVYQLLWPAILWLSVWACCGWPLARQLIPPVIFLYFAIPVWDYTVPVLQRLSIFCSEHLLGLLGVPARVSEYRVTIPEGTFAIIEGCSGKRYFIVTLAVAWLAVAMYRLTGWRALMFLASSALLAMVTNWIRIAIVIYAGHVSNMHSYLVAVEHLTLGNVMFVVLLALVLLLGRWLAGSVHRVPVAQPAPLAKDGAAGAWGLPPIAALVPLALLLLSSAVAGSRASSPVSALGPLPVVADRWQGPLPPDSSWHPHFAGADVERRARYVANGTVELYVSFFATQQNGRELIRYGNDLIAPDDWSSVWSAGADTITTKNGTIASTRMNAPDGTMWLLSYVYIVGQHAFRFATLAKLAYGWQSLMGSAPSGVIAVASPCRMRNCDRTRMLVTDFWDNLGSEFRAMMPDGASQRR